ncbi:MAG TPA: MFS transporter [Polyangia bacterium]|nr:MFS transporter [Polyangia bacterium]
MRRSKVGAIYGAGLLQGLALVTFPAASAVLTSPQAYRLSNAEYGGLFVPQTILAVVASLIGGKLAGRWGEKRVLLLGLLADLSSMAALLASRFVLGQHLAAFALLLSATTLMGIGFGLTVPALNTFAGILFPRRVDGAVLAMNALLGLGTALAPALVALFVGLGFWWGLPLVVGALLAVVIGWISCLSLTAGDAPAHGLRRSTGRFWIFAGFALLYGVAETMNGNWAILYMKSALQASAGFASLALALFWAAATAGRVLFASVARWLPSRNVFRALPWLIGLAFVVTALIPASTPWLGAAAFALAGFGCSALLPLTISFGGAEAPPGELIASYQIGYGMAAFGVGPLHDGAGLGLRVLFGAGVLVALAMAALSIVIVRHGKTTASP